MLRPALCRLLLALGLTLSTLPAAAESPAPPVLPQELADKVTARLQAYAQRKAALDEALKKTPDSLELLTRRGDTRLFLGDAKGAVEDFEREIVLDPSHDAPHWRLGIAYHFAGDFAKSARQFEKYHAYDDHDRENGVWKFFGQARVDGIEKARQQMLEYRRFDREPFPTVYELLAGKKTGDELLAEMKTKKLTDEPLVMFFAHYYLGLHEDLHGRKDSARRHLQQAVILADAAGADGGPGYMGEVARLHYEQAMK